MKGWIWIWTFNLNGPFSPLARPRIGLGTYLISTASFSTQLAPIVHFLITWMVFLHLASFPVLLFAFFCAQLTHSLSMLVILACGFICILFATSCFASSFLMVCFFIHPTDSPPLHVFLLRLHTPSAYLYYHNLLFSVGCMRYLSLHPILSRIFVIFFFSVWPLDPRC